MIENIYVRTGEGLKAAIATDEHAASSYGLPVVQMVLVKDFDFLAICDPDSFGPALGPADMPGTIELNAPIAPTSDGDLGEYDEALRQYADACERHEWAKRQLYHAGYQYVIA